MMELCFITGLSCKGVACEGIYHEATQQCKIIMAINRYLGHIDGPVKTPPPKEVVDPQSTEGVIQRILGAYPQLTKEAVERLIDEERAKAAGLLTEQAAAHLVASNLGHEQQTPVVEAMKSDNPFPELKLGSFLPSIAGRISSPIEIREVTAQGKPTEIANFGITDGASVVTVTIWEPEDTLNGFSVGSWITLTKMSVREYKGDTQISTTRASKISR